MGIKGLLTLINSLQSSELNERENLPVGSTLLVDGNGLVFFTLKKLEQSGFLREYGGNYHSFDALLKKIVSLLRTEYELNVIVYFDGAVTRMKHEILMHRMEQRKTQWINIYNYCEHNEKKKQDDLPMPVLYTDQFRCTLKKLDVPIVFCENEADQEIVKACVSLNAANIENNDQEKFYCVGDDR